MDILQVYFTETDKSMINRSVIKISTRIRVHTFYESGMKCSYNQTKLNLNRYMCISLWHTL